MNTNKIPPTIHYCWFGRGAKPEVFDKCLASWRTYMPNCEIVEWNEDNTDLSFCGFLADAYAAKKWAFVSDVIRLKVVYEYGGIYMDTDVELKEPFDPLMINEAFFFFQNHNQINTGMGFGAAKGNDLVKSMLDIYLCTEFQPDNLLSISCPVLNTQVIKNTFTEFRANKETQLINNMLFVDSDEYWKIANHYGEFSWADEDHRKALRYAKKTHREGSLKRFLRNPNIFQFLEQHHQSYISRIYTFLVYDFVEYGLPYWILRLYLKLTKKMKKCS